MTEEAQEKATKPEVTEAVTKQKPGKAGSASTTKSAAEVASSDRRRSKKGKKKRRVVPLGHAHILASYNNTIVSITDPNGDVLAWSSAGKVGFKGPKKSTPYAAGVVVRDVMEKLADTGLKEVDVFVQGVGSGREAAIRALHVNGVTINLIKDITPMPHNGPRPKKVRRV
ncbi:MAG: 30S ribosomal protein S11 [Patescibacteria group bacterium]|jgi:small subunit ribosomal protein S11